MTGNDITPGSQPGPWGGTLQAAAREAHPIRWAIDGADMQYLEVTLETGYSMVSEAGAMLYKDASITMETVFGDGSAASSRSGFLGKIIGAGKRVLGGDSLFTTIFTQSAQGSGRVAFAAPYPGKIIALDLAAYGGTMICQRESFLAGARGVAISIAFQRKIMTGLFGGDGFIMQKLEGDGMVFIHAGGTLIAHDLAPGQSLHVDTGCVVAYQPSVDFAVIPVGGIKSMLFGGEGLFFASLTGPGKVWLQSLPFSRLAGRVLAHLPAGNLTGVASAHSVGSSLFSSRDDRGEDA